MTTNLVEHRMAARPKQEIIEAHEPHWSSAWVWFAFLAVFGLGEVVLLWAIITEHPWVCVAVAPILGHLMHAHMIAFHEAAHRTLCPSRRWNDAIGVFIGTLSFMGFTLYRTAHHSHHAYLATERDEELWPFVIPGTPRWSRILAAVVELVFGLFYTPALFVRAFLRKGTTIRSRRVRQRIWLELAAIAAVWTAIAAGSTWLHLWRFTILLYLVPAGIAGFLQSLRKYVEHLGLTGATPLSATRSVIPQGGVGRLVAFSLFNIPYHGVHHRYAGLPQSKMPEYAELLAPMTESELPPYPNYRAAFRDMLRSLADPRVGPHWNGVAKAASNAKGGTAHDSIAEPISSAMLN